MQNSSIKELHDVCFGPGDMAEHIAAKAEFVMKIGPAERVMDIGGMWLCNGFYSYLSAANGARETLLLDSQCTPRFKEIGRGRPGVEWIETDFYHGLGNGFLAGLAATRPAEAVILYDIVLHQPDPVRFLVEMVKTLRAKRGVLGNPVSRVNGRTRDLEFAPFSERFKQETGFNYSQSIDDRGGWVWLFSHDFLLRLLKWAGLRVVEEKVLKTWYPGVPLSYSLIRFEQND